MKGDDKDLAAHFTIIRQYGVTLHGEEIENVFGEVPRKDYIDSIWEDVRDAREEILEQPMYITLNLCRVLAFCREGLCLSKQEGARWAMEHLPAGYTPIISDALMCYQTDREIVVEEEDGKKFADEMLAAIEKAMG